ncbi:MAG: hypothetical protein L3J63_03790 [Geopsychrobacter sp.]|nr:hypothetical protein [Geopsychrobacter sp.]
MTSVKTNLLLLLILLMLASTDLAAECETPIVKAGCKVRHLMATLIEHEPLTFLVVRDNRGYLLQLPQD